MDLKEFREFIKTEEGAQEIKAFNRTNGLRARKYPIDSESYYKKFFFKLASLVTWVLFLLGLLGIVLIFVTTGDPFKAASLVFLLVWLVIFVRYFLWAVYHYNVNYGLSIKAWENIEDAKERFKRGETVLASELEEPNHNPYRSQTFGVPPGTVRGMLAFTLLFGAISILIASMGMEQVDLENSLIRDQFEFFKTAFLMMMAFYFGDKSLRFLQKRWKNPNPNNQNNSNPPDDSNTEYLNKQRNYNSANVNGSQEPVNVVRVNSQSSYSNSPIGVDDAFHMEEEREFAEVEKLHSGLVGSLTNLKVNLNAADPEMADEELKLQKEKFGIHDDDAEDGQMSCTLPNIPIIDAGHGGVDKNGNYTSGNKKRYEFKGEGQENFEILEGEINRKIAVKLLEKLDALGIPYYDLNSKMVKDMPLSERVKKANEIYSSDRSSYFLSIHSNATSPSLKGRGTNANGFEIWTSKGPTDSDKLAEIAKQSYLKFFGHRFKFRGLKQRDRDQSDLYVLKKTRCPAILVENLFFDNYQEALYLKSEKGQDEIAECLVDVIKSISCIYEA